MHTLIFTFCISVVSYLIGSIPTGYLVVRKFTGKNILEHGTGNVGTMNTHRTTNNKLFTFVVFLGDHAKGLVVYFIAWLVFQNLNNLDFAILLSVTFFSVILGHNYSIFLKFKGGKGLATAAGFFLALNPTFYLAWVILFFITMSISGYFVLGQMLATLLVLPFIYFVDPGKFFIVLPAAILVIVKHAPRMKNVLNGTEPKMYYKIREK